MQPHYCISVCGVITARCCVNGHAVLDGETQNFCTYRWRIEDFLPHFFHATKATGFLFAQCVFNLYVSGWDGLKKLMMPLLENLSKELKMNILVHCILGIALFCHWHSWVFTLFISPCLCNRWNCQRWQNSLLKINQSFSTRGIVSYNNHINPQLKGTDALQFTLTSKACLQRHISINPCPFVEETWTTCATSQFIYISY